jgi:predicted dehydrogenase
MKTGIVGIGFMGLIHYLAMRKVNGASVGAICTRDEKKLAGDWTSIQGNFGPRGQQEDLSGIATYADFNDLLNDDDIDMLDLCLPTNLHTERTIAGLEAGKHVLLEKPISLSLDDAHRMMDAAKANNRKFMVAHVLPFFPEFAYALNVVQSRDHGKLLGGHLKRIIAAPDWSNEHLDYSLSGGPGIDLHIHDTHFVRLLCGTPKTVSSVGIMGDDNYATYLSTLYSFEDGRSLSCASGAMSQPGRPFTHGYELYLENATLVHEAGIQPVQLLKKDGSIETPDLGDGDPVDSFTLELQYAVDAIVNDSDATSLSGEAALDALLMCYKEVESVKTGLPVAL